MSKNRVNRLKARHERLVKQGVLVEVKKVDGTTKYVHKDKVWSTDQRFVRTVKALMRHILVDDHGRLIPITDERGKVVGNIHPAFRDRLVVSQEVVDAAVARKFALIKREVA